MKKRKQGVGEPNKSLESRWTWVGGLLLHSRAAVNPSQQSLPPIILVHGLGVSSRYMLPSARLLAAERPVYAVDLPGFGRSEKPRRALSLGEQAGALIDWMSESEIPRATFVANSIGCQIVIDLALSRPDIVERIVLVSPTIDLWARTVFKQYFRLLLDIPREPLSLSFIALVDYLGAGLGRVAETFASALEDRVEEKLPHVRQPTLIVRGERDPLVSQRWAEEVTRLLPDGRLVVIERAAHGVNYNSPEKLARSVLDFLKAQAVE